MMPTTSIAASNKMDFLAGSRDFSIRIRRVHPTMPTRFVVHETGSNRVLGANSCPALTANPNYVEVFVRRGVAFSVQAIDGGITVEEPVNK